MKRTLKNLLVAAIGVGPIASLPALTGCESHYHDHDGGHARVAVHDRDTYVVTPGYYYDREYYEPNGRLHNRTYYYYDGKRWDNRDAVPSGYTARERQQRQERQERHDRHDRHDAHHEHDTF